MLSAVGPASVAVASVANFFKVRVSDALPLLRTRDGRARCTFNFIFIFNFDAAAVVLDSVHVVAFAAAVAQIVP